MKDEKEFVIYLWLLGCIKNFIDDKNDKTVINSYIEIEKFFKYLADNDIIDHNIIIKILLSNNIIEFINNKINSLSSNYDFKNIEIRNNINKIQKELDNRTTLVLFNEKLFNYN